MKSFVACLLILCLLLLPVGCSNDTSTSRKSSKRTTNDSTTTATTTTTDTPSAEEKPLCTEADARAVAEEKIGAYFNATIFGVCCDIEYADGDMTPFLTEEQKEYYPYNQWKITCCTTVAEVKEHMKRCVADGLLPSNTDDLLPSDVEDLLFFDDQHNLYVMVLARGFEPRGEVVLTTYSPSRITATVTQYCTGEDPLDAIGQYLFTLENIQQNFLITDVTYTPIEE